MDDDLQRRLRDLADEASPRPGSEDVVVKKARTKRRLVALSAGLAVVLAIGGLAGAATLLGERGIGPAPGPDETAGCVSADYDAAVFVPEEDFHDNLVEIEEHLRDHDAVASFKFVSAAEAMQEYLRENPDQEGPAPTQARRSQYRVTVKPGVDPHRLSRELAEVGDGAFVPALDCPPTEPQQKFARYFFEAAEGNSSARGTLEVNWEARTICLDVDISADLVASHLIDQHPEAPEAAQGEGPNPIVTLTFFELGDTLDSFQTKPICLRDQDPDLLRQVIEDHERFAVDFHRGPDDEAGLVAELISQQQADACSGGPTITVVGGPAEPGDRVAFTGECWPDGPESRELKMFLTASLGGDGRPIPKEDLVKGKVACDFVARADNKVTFSHEKLHGWFVVPHEGNCTPKKTFRVPLLGGTYEVAVGCPACSYATVRVIIRRIAGSFKSLDDAMAYLSDRLDIPVALPEQLPDEIRLAPRGPVTVTTKDGLWSGRLELRFGNNGILSFDFGRAIFDGCGGDGAEQVDINGEPGLMLAKDEYPWTQIIWPAQPGDREGTYGIYGSLPAAEMLELARSMPHLRGTQANKREACL